VYPTAPSALEVVRVVVPENQVVADLPGYNNVLASRTRISMASNHVVVVLVVNNDGFPIIQTPPLDLPLGQLPAGEYQVEVRRETESGAALPALGQASFTVAARGSADPLWNNTDMWWNANQSGWGISVVQHGTRNIFATIYLYGSDGSPLWYVVPGGTWLGPSTFQGTVYRTSGPQLGAGYDPSKVTVTPVGSAILDFVSTSYDRATVNMTIDGKNVVTTIQRQSF